jgi:hypothetical protein
MKTTLDIEDILFAAVKASPLASAINGGVYKRQRPVNSAVEDIVVNCLPVGNTQLQRAVANINIHVPNLSVTKGGITDNSMANHSRLKELAGMVEASLDDQFAQDYGYEIQQQQLFQDEVANDHYVNFRINFYSFNV